MRESAPARPCQPPSAQAPCGRMTPPSPAPLRTPIPPLPGIVWGLILLCLLPELVLQGADHGLWGSARWRPLAYQNGAFWAGLLYGWRPNYAAQPWVMFLSYAWLHAGAAHLAGNLGALLWLGPQVAARRGAAGLILIWLAAVLGGGVAFGVLATTPAPMVGASGAVFGLAADWLVAEVRAARGTRARMLRAAALVAFLVAINIAAWALQGGQLAWETHLGGFLAGAGLVLVWPRRKSERAAP